MRVLLAWLKAHGAVYFAAGVATVWLMIELTADRWVSVPLVSPHVKLQVACPLLLGVVFVRTPYDAAAALLPPSRRADIRVWRTLWAACCLAIAALPSAGGFAGIAPLTTTVVATDLLLVLSCLVTFEIACLWALVGGLALVFTARPALEQRATWLARWWEGTAPHERTVLVAMTVLALLTYAWRGARTVAATDLS